LTEEKLREMKKWLNGKETGDLWFSEAPYKVWTAKPTGNSSIKYIPFDETYTETSTNLGQITTQTKTRRVYKGEGNV
jgi:phage-related protein